MRAERGGSSSRAQLAVTAATALELILQSRDSPAVLSEAVAVAGRAPHRSGVALVWLARQLRVHVAGQLGRSDGASQAGSDGPTAGGGRTVEQQ